MVSKKQAKLIDKSATVQSDDQVGALSVPGAQIVEVQEESWASIIFGWLKNIFIFLALAAVVLAALYSGLAATIIVYSPTNSEGDRNFVLRGTWSETGGIPPVGTEVAISQDTLAPKDNWWDWIPIGWTGIPNVSTVEIATTDYDKLYINNVPNEGTKVVVLENESINGEFKRSPALPLKDKEDNVAFEVNHQLKNEFLVHCVSGSCEKGTYFVISKDQIFGEIR